MAARRHRPLAANSQSGGAERSDEMAEEADLRARVTALEKADILMESRVSEIEKWKHLVTLDNAVRAEQWANIIKRLDSIDKNTGWLIKTVVGGLIIALLAYIISGGIKV